MTEYLYETPETGVAIIGMAGRFPGAEDINQFWENLCNGVESTTFFTEDQIDPSIDRALVRRPDYVKARGVLQNADKFDAAFFGISAAEAAIMDPQQRILLEVAWESLENAGYMPDTYEGMIGIYAGMNNNTYFQNFVSKRPDLIERFGAFQAMLANEKDFLTTRISYKLNLTGPSINVFTACSTSLVAVCHAYSSLLNYQCDLALAGGISIVFPQNSGHIYQEGAILSKDGHCRPFDAQSNGTPFCDGTGLVVLKRLDEAVEDRDYIYAVIRGCGMNNDGLGKVSFTAPSVDGQAEAIAMAQAQAGVDPDMITYIEAHGTGTRLGDPIEIEALTQVFREKTQARRTCAIGSVKSNFGHLVHAAGIAGLIKTALALKHHLIPPSINFESPNPEINFEDSPFYVNTRLQKWESNGSPRRAGVSSFGVGGTNAHVILEESPPEVQSDLAAKNHQILLLSAKTGEALDRATANLSQYLSKATAAPLAHIAYTLQKGRKHFPFRRFVVCDDQHSAVASLGQKDLLESNTACCRDENSAIVFMFPGQGAQYAKMGEALYNTEPVYRRAFEDCSRFFEKHAGIDLKSALYAASGKCFNDEQLRETRYTQPALFAIEYAMARLLMHWGMAPSAMIGHSVGEFVAASLSGVCSLDDACFLIAHRSRLLQEMPHGAMLSVRQPESEIVKYLSGSLSLAAVNSPSLCVVSGEAEEIENLQKRLEAKQVASKILNTSHAFHSHMVEPAVEQFEALIKPIDLHPPQIPFVSTVSGAFITDEQATSHHYWAGHMRKTVRFADGIRTILNAGDRILVEVGPGSTLTVLSNQQITGDSGNRAVTLIGGKHKEQSENYRLLNSVGRLWISGVSFEWDAFHPREGRNRVPLPTYAFERRRYWVDRPQPEALPQQAPEVKNDEPANDKQESSMKNEEIDMTAVKKDWLTSKTVTLLEEISGETIEKENFELSFLEIGFDSLFLTQASLALKKEFNVEVAFRQLMEDYTNVPDLVEYLMQNVSDAIMPADIISPQQGAPMNDSNLNNEMMQTVVNLNPATGNPGAPGPVAGDINDLFSRQLAVIEKQLEILRVPGAAVAGRQAAMVQSKMPEVVSRSTDAPAAQVQAPASGAGQQTAPDTTEEESSKKFVGPQLKIKKKVSSALTPEQLQFIDAFSRRYIVKTNGSKQYTQQHRNHLADPRAVAGFNPLFKELVYPIVVNRSQGARLWDIDNNEYVDMLSGFGSNFFGFSAPFVKEAVAAQMDRGIEIGPQHELAGEVAEMICKITRFDRAAFCNTGSEAVLGALRIARTVTGRNTVAMFNGAYHGIFNEVINRGKKDYTSLPAAPGITRDSVKNMLVFDYGEQKSLDALKERGSELAAIIVEPVQSRAPELQPKVFLQQLREIANEFGIALIFDEVVTGFRTCLGGAQEYFDIRADIATYGKVLGGGWPIGVIAGKAAFMDALDGGQWQYGDASIPEVGVTYFAGTFVRYPPALAAARAVLTYLSKEGPELQVRLNRRCAEMVDQLNANFSMLGAPLQIHHFASVMKIAFTEEIQHEELLYFLLREKGVHIWHHRPCFLTLAHTDEDIQFVINAFNESVKELQQADFLPNYVKQIQNKDLVAKADATKPPIPGARLGKNPEGNPAWFIKDPHRPGKYLQVGG